MKRAEVVKEIFYKLEQFHSHPEANAELANQILNTVEQLGMLPPRYDFMVGTMRASDNAWEPESEN
jgi:hypothetical protein